MLIDRSTGGKVLPEDANIWYWKTLCDVIEANTDWRTHFWVHGRATSLRNIKRPMLRHFMRAANLIGYSPEGAANAMEYAHAWAPEIGGKPDPEYTRRNLTYVCRKRWMVLTGGMRVRELARRIGVSPAAVSAWKYREPTMERILKICGARGLTFSSMLAMIRRVWILP